MGRIPSAGSWSSSTPNISAGCYSEQTVEGDADESSRRAHNELPKQHKSVPCGAYCMRFDVGLKRA